MSDASETVGATARIFWAYEGLALAAALVAFPPDKVTTFNDAIGELRRIAEVQIGADEVDAALIDPSNRAIGAKIFEVVQETASAEKITLSSGLAANSTYFLVDQGPQNLNFAEYKVSDLIDWISKYEKNPAYVVLVPQPEALRVALQQKFQGEQGAVMSFNIICNYAPDRCQADVYVNPLGSDIGAQHDLEFFVPRTSVALNYGVRDIVDAKYPTLKGSWFDVSAIKQVEDEVAELTLDAAIGKLQELRKAEDSQLSFFDVSLSGSLARLAAPIALAILAFSVWASASGLAALGISRQDIDRTLFLPLIRTGPATVVRIAAFGFPLAVGVGLLIKAWPGGIASWAIPLITLGLQTLAGFAAFRLFSRIAGKPEAKRRASR